MSLRSQASRFAPADLLHALEVLTAAEQETKRSNQHRLILEMALLRLMRLPSQAAPPSAVAVVPPSAVAVVPPRSSNGESKSVGALLAAPIETTPIETASVVTKPAPVIEPAPAVPYDMPPPLAEAELSDLEDDEDDISLFAVGPGDEELDLLPSVIVTSADDPGEEFTELPPAFEFAAEEAGSDLLQVQQVAFEAPIPEPVKPVQSPDTPPELLKLQKAWQEVLNLVGSRSPVGVQDVKAAKPVAIQDHFVMLEFDNQFSFDRVQSKEKGRRMVEEIIDRTLAAEPGTYKVKCVMAGQPLPVRGGSGRVSEAKPISIAASKREPLAVAADAPGPFVDEVIAVFGGRLLDDDAY